MSVPSAFAAARGSAIPGFEISLGITVLYLGLIVLAPLGVLGLKAASAVLGGIVGVLAQPRVLSAFRVSFGIAFVAAAIDAVLGLVIAWVLVRSSFPGRRLLDAMIDLPFALPTAVAGIALTTLYADTGWLGAPL